MTLADPAGGGSRDCERCGRVSGGELEIHPRPRRVCPWRPAGWWERHGTDVTVVDNSSKNLHCLPLERSFEVTRGHQPSFANNF